MRAFFDFWNKLDFSEPVKKTILYTVLVSILVLALAAALYWRRDQPRKISRDNEQRRYKYMPEYEQR